ncbi:hypothetical protein NBO_32g0005 [Nosema bombycis CQ1]|uniref:Uncharacterized protein n=1 Tax=Nosema bombycis (strain CQ1 / CVCC 102059) TaxID=578461 RepID=R0MJ38_NOSB1|nr:hypothetical protein NBO_32g0005 [Nosema bombycis CQ1]|eukprot:EOB14230.1 hypothetical protein NBO_32g0005 [Nosema bombycis CQ1]
MRDLSFKLEELMIENKKLYEELASSNSTILKLKNKNNELEKNETVLNDKISQYKREINTLKKEMALKDKTANDREKILSNEINRKDLFKNKVLGCKKNEQLKEIKEEFNKMNKRCTILLRMIYELVRVNGADYEILYNLLEISENEDCEILEEYLKNLKEI